MPKILITGAGGAIGSHLTEYLIKNSDYNLALGYFTEKEIPQNIEKN